MRERALELYALGLPTAIILRETGLTSGALYWVVSKHPVRRPSVAEQREVMREIRLSRIKANIVASPSQSMFQLEWAA